MHYSGFQVNVFGGDIAHSAIIESASFDCDPLDSTLVDRSIIDGAAKVGRLQWRSPAAGNGAYCFPLQRAPSIARLAAWSKSLDLAVCFFWQNRGRLQVRCFQRGYRIRFCGHGLLACAHVWLHLQRPDYGASLALLSSGRHFEFCRRHGSWWLRLQRAQCHPGTLSVEVGEKFQPPPIKTALSGTAQGYKIFEWPVGTDIANLKIETAYLHSDGRAAILTAAAEECSFTLRYLAPQYGIDEDAATGSANAVLADYWSGRGLTPPFRAHQCSPVGGVILSDCEGEYVFIGGRVVIEATVFIDVVSGDITRDRVNTRLGQYRRYRQDKSDRAAALS